MSDQEGNYQQRAAEHWRKGEFLEAGQLLFENIPKDAHVDWASHLLQLVVEKSGVNLEPIADLLLIAGDPVEWGRARPVFNTLRDMVLELEKLPTKTQE